ncbi:hypothetical protein C5167_000624, partial [Papaver somniferum]
DSHGCAGDNKRLGSPAITGDNLLPTIFSLCINVSESI